jgi:hypothetical protein
MTQVTSFAVACCNECKRLGETAIAHSSSNRSHATVFLKSCRPGLRCACTHAHNYSGTVGLQQMHVLRQSGWNAVTYKKKKKNSVALSPQANYTDWATSTFRRNLVPTFADRGVSRGQRGGSPMAVNLGFLDRRRYFLSSSSSFIITRAEWIPFQTHCYSETLAAPGIEAQTSQSEQRLAASYTTEGPVLKSRWWREFSFLHNVQTGFGTHRFPSQWLPGLKQPALEAHHSPTASAGSKKCDLYIHSLHTSSWRRIRFKFCSHAELKM